MSEMAPALDVSGLAFGFGADSLWEDVSFRIETGAIHGLFGTNGSGKTTLFNVISGFQRPRRGALRYWGQVPVRHSPADVSELGRGLSRTFQVPAVVDDLTVEENLLLSERVSDEDLFAAILKPRDPARALAHAVERVIAEFELQGIRECPVATASYGLRRLVSTMTAVLSGAGLILLDEPFANLSAENVARLKVVLKNEARRNSRSFLIIEHEPEDLIGFVDALHLLRGGVSTLTAPELTHEVMARLAAGLDLP